MYRYKREKKYRYNETWRVDNRRNTVIPGEKKIIARKCGNEKRTNRS